jgi:hypothetical protein
MIRIASLALLLASTAAFADGKASTSPDAQSVDQACAADGQTAGCGGEQVGTGLMKCIHAYHKAHKDFKPSAACHAAMQKLHQDAKAKKSQ